MKLQSVSGITCYVKDIEATAKFYEMVGFRLGTMEPGLLKVYVNWFWVQFCAQDVEDKPEFQKEATSGHKGAGLFLNIKVENVDEVYGELVSKGLKPSSEPRDWPWGNREFVIRDPDGYKLVFFQRK